MHICIIGTGAIGSVFAFRLAKAGHTITAVARGQRFSELRDGVVLSDGDTAPVEARETFDPSVAYDLVMVTMFASGVDSVLPVLRDSKAKKVMFLFNTFETIDRFRDAVGAQRSHFGFPGGIFSKLEEGRVFASVRAGTTVDDESYAKLFRDAGIPTAVDHDMQSWLRSHAAMVAPLMLAGAVVARRTGGLSWAEARQYSIALREGVQVVKHLGHKIAPRFIETMAKLPLPMLTFMMWTMNKTQMQKQLGRMGTAEPVMLVQQMTALAPGRTQALLSIMP